MRLRLFTPGHPIPDVWITPREWKPDLDVTIKHDDLYARAPECEYEKPTFDSDKDRPNIPNSTGITLRSDPANYETGTFSGTIREDSPEIFPIGEESCDLMDTDIYKELDADKRLEQPNPTPINPAAQPMIYFTIQSRTGMRITDIEFLIQHTMSHGTHTYTFRKS